MVRGRHLRWRADKVATPSSPTPERDCSPGGSRRSERARTGPAAGSVDFARVMTGSRSWTGFEEFRSAWRMRWPTPRGRVRRPAGEVPRSRRAGGFPAPLPALGRRPPRRQERSDRDYSGRSSSSLQGDGVPALRDIPVVPYLELQVGYNTHGYEPNDGVRTTPIGGSITESDQPVPSPERHRFRRPEGGKIQRCTDTVLEFLQVPAMSALTYQRF